MDALAPALPAALSPLVLDLALHPDDAAALWRAPAVAAWRQGRRVAATTLATVWQDTPDGTLARDGWLVAEQRAGTRLEPLRRGLAVSPPPLPEGLTPVARLDASARWLRRPDALGEIRVVVGTVQAAGRARPACRLALSGCAAEAYRVAHALAGTLRVSVPLLTLAGEAAELGGVAVPVALGAPVLPAQVSAEAALAAVVAHLTAVLLHWVPLARPDAGEEPVHQMRVATRRLRAALKLFGRAAGCPSVDAAQDGLRALAGALGAARDWDVFLAGLGADVARAFPDERAVAAMLRAARRQRQAGYAALAETLEGPGFRGLCLLLDEIAVTRPWQVWNGADPVAAASLHADVAAFGRAALDRRLRAVRHAGRGFSRRSTAELHALRIQCKRLRYACELFAPCFPGAGAARFMRRLAALQERLGVLNDGATAESLMQRVGRGLAAGLVRGFAASREAAARAEAGRGWKRFRACEGFW